MAGNKTLGKAKMQKKDEFYTQLSDIENELRHYKQHFRGKTVLCNCDDPYESNFFKYFAMNFNALELKKLIATCYATSPVTGNEFQCYIDKNNQLSFAPSANNIPLLQESGRKPYKVEITEITDENGDGRIDLADVEYLMRNKKNTLTLLDRDGDFRSDECVELLKEADIVVTNPPFSLFREYVAQLISYDKRFVIIGNQNALHYKEIFPLIQSNKLWLGYGFPGNVGFFESPYEDIAVSTQHKAGMIRISGVMWFTNLDIEKRHEKLLLFKPYIPELYPTYENYSAINIDKTADIPFDYMGNMGVLDNFLEHYNPEQFEIVGLGCGDLAKLIGIKKNYRGRTDLAYKIDGKDKCPYSRVIIRRKQVKTNEN